MTISKTMRTHDWQRWAQVLGALMMCIFSSTALPVDAADLETEIDAVLEKAHSRVRVQPMAVCDEATFLRRLSLDLIGRVPTVDELHSFLAAPDRDAMISKLLGSDEHAIFWSHLWTTMLVGRGEQRAVEHEVLRRWIESQLQAHVPLDQISYALITAEGVTSLDGPVNFVVASRQDPVMRLTRTFLSVQLDCAQCHDHPHDRWTQADYEAMQRFYQPTQYRQVSGGVAVRDGESSEKVPVFLTGRQPHTSAWRRELGLMVIQSKPFSRAMVNRVWHWLMGRGLIDPVDGLSRENPASVPDLLEVLANDLRNDGFRLQPLIQRICRSRAYQREVSLLQTSEAEVQREMFAARNARPLNPEQWIASVETVLDRPRSKAPSLAVQSRRLIGNPRQTNTVQDPFDWTVTTQALVRQLAGEMPAPLRDVDATFLATVARLPTDEERRLVSGHTSKQVLFALVHGTEFTTND